MRISNPLQMNDWGIGKFLKVVLAVQLSVLGAIGWELMGLDKVGLGIHVIRILVCSIYLTLIPGMVALRALKLHRLGNIESALYAVGLSLSILALTGLVMNALYPSFQILKPMSLIPETLTISAVVLFLCFVSYVRDREFCDPDFLDLDTMTSTPALFLYSLPPLTICGVLLDDFNNNSVLLMIMMVAIIFTVIAVAFTNIVPRKLYPLAVSVIAVSLLFQTWLLSMYIWGKDIHSEYYFSNLVVLNSVWDPTIPVPSNGTLSLTIIAPIYSSILGTDITWIFKIVEPLLFSLIPLGLYRILQRQTNDRIAFLSCFFFMTAGFYNVWLFSVKQLSAELFIVLLVLVMTTRGVITAPRSLMLIAFSALLISSHYGTSYIFMIIIILALLFLRLTGNTESRKQEAGKALASSTRSVTRLVSTIGGHGGLTWRYVSLFVILAIAWYSYTSGSTSFNAVVDIGNHIAATISGEFLNPKSAEGLGILIAEPTSSLGQVFRITSLITQFLIIAGVAALIFKRDNQNFTNGFKACSLAALLVLVLSIVLPYFSSAIYTPRLYGITLIFLSPFCIVGGIVAARAFKSLIPRLGRIGDGRSALKSLSILLTVLFLFSSGFAYEVAKGPPSSVPLSKDRMMNSPNPLTRAFFYYDYNVFAQDYYGVTWLSDSAEKGFVVYSDSTTSSLSSYGMMGVIAFTGSTEHHKVLSNTTTSVPSGSFVYLGYANTVGGVLFEVSFAGREASRVWGINEISPLLNSISRIYDNGGNELYYG